MHANKIDTIAVAVWLSLLLFLMGMSILVPKCFGHAALRKGSDGVGMPVQGDRHGTQPTQTNVSQAPVVAAAAVEDNEDGAPDHWADPRYRVEARLQMAWIGGVLTVLAGYALVARGTKRSAGHA
jgi:hypothetical protein